MWIGVVSLFPELIETIGATGVLGRAIERGTLELETFNPRDHAADKHSTVDDRPYGGGPGMVMMVDPLVKAIDAAASRAPTPPIVLYLSPQGQRLDQKGVVELAGEQSLILIAGRYEGIDERVVELRVDREVSIGDYVLSGGELAAMVVVDAISRYLPGTLGNSESLVEESHLDGLLDYPHYTRPESAGGLDVPAVLLSGDHEKVAHWRMAASLRRTLARRPDLLAGRCLSDQEIALLETRLESDE